MNLVKYSLNGIYFDYYGVYVSDSIGIADGLERKPVQSYDWAEYHGISVDLEKPKYKERKIELKCFIDGDDWQDLFVSFKDFLLKEFSKSGIQRLIIEPLEDSPLVYDVFMQDGIKLEKRFSKGKMIGTFSLMLIEPNPIKRILFTTNAQLSIAYNSPTETDIIIDGTRYQGKEVVNFTKNLTPRSILYNGGDNNLIINSAAQIMSPNETGSGHSQLMTNEIDKYYKATPNAQSSVSLYGAAIQSSNNIHMRGVYVRSSVGQEISIYDYSNQSSSLGLRNVMIQANTWTFITTTAFKGTTGLTYMILESKIKGVTLDYKKAIAIKGSNINDWKPALEDQHYISIAGNIEDITNFTTNAEVLWEKI